MLRRFTLGGLIMVVVIVFRSWLPPNQEPGKLDQLQPVVDDRQTASYPEPALVQHQDSSDRTLTELLDCLRQSCEFPESDPRAYELAVGGAIHARLVMASQKYERNDLGQSEFIDQLLIGLRVTNGHVQVFAIKQLATLPVSVKVFEQVNAVLTSVVDPLVFKQSLGFLKKYQANGFQIPVSNLVKHLIAHGGHYVSLEASKSLDTLINESNWQDYSQLLNVDEISHRKKKLINQSLTEFHRQQTGG